MINLTKETVVLAELLAAAQGLSVEEAIRQALEARARAAGVLLRDPQMRRDQSAAAIAARKASVDRIVADIAAMPILDSGAPREIMDELNAL